MGSILGKGGGYIIIIIKIISDMQNDLEKLY